MKTKLLYSGIIGAVVGAALMGGGAAWAQSAPDTGAEEQPTDKNDIVIVTGTRTAGRSMADSPVPVDVLTGFLSPEGKAYGRPVGVAIDARGALLVADDVGKVVWRVSAKQAAER